MRVIPTRFAGALAAFFAMVSPPLVAQDKDAGWSLAIHGGAGTIARENMTPEQDAAYRAALQRALDAGAAVLRDGGSAMEAIQAAIEPMEDDALFNAGRGAVLTWDGDIELDASIMDGRTRDAGAVAGVTGIRHPIELARLVMTDSPHVMLAGKGAETFAEEQGLERIAARVVRDRATKGSARADEGGTAFRSRCRYQVRYRGCGRTGQQGQFGRGNLDRRDDGQALGARRRCPGDRRGHLCRQSRPARYRRPAGGNSSFGSGWAQEICTRIRLVRQQAAFASGSAQHAEWLAGQDYVQRITDAVLAEVEELGGDGGVIVVTPLEDPVFGMNTSGMYRGRATSGGVNEVAIYADE